MAKDRTKEALSELNEDAASRKKLELVAAWVQAEGKARIENESWGEVTVRMRWEKGVLKEVKLTEETIVRDLAQVGLACASENQT